MITYRFVRVTILLSIQQHGEPFSEQNGGSHEINLTLCEPPIFFSFIFLLNITEIYGVVVGMALVENFVGVVFYNFHFGSFIFFHCYPPQLSAAQLTAQASFVIPSLFV